MGRLAQDVRVNKLVLQVVGCVGARDPRLGSWRWQG